MGVRKLLAVALVVGLTGTGCDSAEKEPVTAASSAPPVAAVDPRMIANVSPLVELPGAKPAPSGARLIGPSYRLHVVETATATSLGDAFLPWFRVGEVTPPGPVSAGEGREFLLARLSGKEGEKEYAMFPSTLVDGNQVRVEVGTESRAVPPMITSDGVLLMVVPVGAPVRLVVRDAGREQRLDLRTGKPGADYSAGAAEGAGEWDVYGTYPGDRIGSSVNVKAKVSLDSFNDTPAPAGKIWLKVSLALSYSSWRKLGGDLDAARSIRVTVGGRTLSMDADATGLTLLTSGIPNHFQNNLYAEALVPANSVTKVSIRFSPAGKLTQDGKATTFRATSVPTETITLK